MTAAPALAAPPAAVPARRTERQRSQGRAAWNLAAIVVVWATSLVVVAVWVAGGEVQSLAAGGADTLNALGRAAGLASANLLFYQVLLMARVPLFERGFGRDGITRMHRIVGFWSFALFSAHIGLQILGYAVQAGIDPLEQAWQFVWDYPGMLLATAGTGLLLLVVVTSVRKARRRLRYESWHLLHLYGYLGVGLAIPHMLWTGADFTVSPAATSYWWAMWGVTVATVVVFRLGLPLARSLRHGIRVGAVERDGRSGVSVRMTGRRIDALRARGGQFFVWRFLDGAGWTRGHPFSLATDPADGELVISARFVGDGTHRLATLRPGTRVLIEGPYGTMTADERRGGRLLMIGAGAGVAPLVAILEEAEWTPGEATLIVRDHTADDALRVGAIDRLVRERGLRHAPLPGPRARTTSPWLPASHAQWAGADLIRYVSPLPAETDVFLCGPQPWMDAVRTDLRRAGVPAERVHLEAFTV
ncbi:ferredoxin reductase family protein [Microbacterium sp. KSW2-29]|uniref:Ferredoxin reductase family protein n=1 Tax=Microbacterium phycohabitans TaxID=3075993 RepID=A0ABU3SQL2_9MICO|nr:ferredoxin reductase family protein [Microbacterium sp. KSW2-29]MDU0346977.1 ferredoxin reductase family protein [Microbacterium sp. KSW2-29]